MMNTAPPSLWFKAIRATVVRILSSHEDEHVLDFEQDDIPTTTIDPDTHNTLTNLWSKRISTEHALNKLLDSGLDVDIEDEYFTLARQHNVAMWVWYFGGRRGCSSGVRCRCLLLLLAFVVLVAAFAFAFSPVTLAFAVLSLAG